MVEPSFNLLPLIVLAVIGWGLLVYVDWKEKRDVRRVYERLKASKR